LVNEKFLTDAIVGWSLLFFILCTSENQLQMDQEINVHGKKKVASKRISGLQYLPSDSDSDKVMVTSADSQIRIICGEDVICKLKG